MKGKKTPEAETTDTDGWQCVGPYELVHPAGWTITNHVFSGTPCGYCDRRAPSAQISIPPKTLDAGTPSRQVLLQRSHQTVDTTA